MNTLNEKSLKLIKLELNKTPIKVSPKVSGREGVDFAIKANTGNFHKVYLQPIDLDTERKVKISKLALGEPKDNLWVALVLIIDNEPLNFYLIIHCFLLFFKGIHEYENLLRQIRIWQSQCFTFPSKIVTTPDNYIFFRE